MISRALSPVGLPQVAVAINATTPAGDFAGQMIWSTTANCLLIWNGTAWTSPIPQLQSVTSSATVTPTFANDQVNITAQAANLTLANPTGTAIDGWGIAIRIFTAAARTLTFGTQYRAMGVTLPATTVAGKTLYLGIVYNAADTKWDVVAVAQEA